MNAALRLVPSTPPVAEADVSLRPLTFDEYVGQRDVIDNLKTSVRAAKRGGWQLDHMLFAGAPGCIAGDMRLQWEVRTIDGKRQNHKGGSLETLYRRFNRLPSTGKGSHLRPETIDSLYFVSSMDEDGKIYLHEIADVIDSGVKECVRVRTARGFELVCTADHPLATNEGFLAVEKLREGSVILTHQNRRWTEVAAEQSHINRPEIFVKHHPTARAKVVRDKARGYVNAYKRLFRAHAVYEAHMNGLALDEYVARLNEGRLDGLTFLASGVNVHHRDEDPFNDVPENLVALSHEEHARVHAPADGLGFRIATEDKIISIEKAGSCHVYDIKMKGAPHNFVVEHFIVHNCGKTSLAQTVANELKARIRVTSAPAISHKGELASLLVSLQDGDVLFIDEIHRLSVPLQEILYTAMEDRVLDMAAGRKVIRVPLPKFTLLGATTHAGLLSAPLRDRFGFCWQLRFYDVADLTTIVLGSADKLGVAIDEEGAAEVARHAAPREPAPAARPRLRARHRRPGRAHDQTHRRPARRRRARSPRDRRPGLGRARSRIPPRGERGGGRRRGDRERALGAAGDCRGCRRAVPGAARVRRAHAQGTRRHRGRDAAPQRSLAPKKTATPFQDRMPAMVAITKKKTGAQLNREIKEALSSPKASQSSPPRWSGQDDYERRELANAQRKLEEVRRAPLADRKEAQTEFFEAMRDTPALVAERIGWLLDGSYGWGEGQLAKQVLANTRLNRAAALTHMIGAFEWQCPDDGARAAWKKLSASEKARLDKAVQSTIDAAAADS